MFCNINFRLISKSKLFDLENNDPKCIVTVNAQFIVIANSNRRFMNILNKYYSTFDGEVPLKFAKRQTEYRCAESIKGSEIIYDFINYAKMNNLKIFLLGGKELSNSISVEKIRSEYGVKADGYSPPYEEYPFSDETEKKNMEKIEKFCPDILFVGFGAPKQEFFIEDHYDEFKQIGIKYIVGCGGTFEFLSGIVKRAPRWVSKMGAEGVYRLFQEMNKSRWERLVVSTKFFRYIKHKPDYYDTTS